MSSTGTAQPRDRWIPYYFFLFFAVIFAVDGVMITIAIKTNPGIITDHPYEKGLAYNSVVEAEQGQQALGWKSTLLYQQNAVHFSLRDASGKAITPDMVTAYFTRPMQGGMDFSASMAISQNGQFTATPAFPAKGLWEVRVYAKRLDETYQQSKRIVVE